MQGFSFTSPVELDYTPLQLWNAVNDYRISVWPTIDGEWAAAAELVGRAKYATHPALAVALVLHEQEEQKWRDIERAEKAGDL